MNSKFEATDSRAKWITEEAATFPSSNHVQVIENRWWVTHPDHGLMFYKSGVTFQYVPQCNESEEITKSVVKHMFAEGFEAKFFEKVYVPAL